MGVGQDGLFMGKVRTYRWKLTETLLQKKSIIEDCKKIQEQYGMLVQTLRGLYSNMTKKDKEDAFLKRDKNGRGRTKELSKKKRYPTVNDTFIMLR